MLFLNKIFPESKFLILANDETIVLYEQSQNILIAKLTLQINASAEQILPILSSYKNVNITLVLDPKNETNILESLPDIGEIRTKKKLKDKLKKMSGDILSPLIVQSPSKKDQTWKCLITKATLSRNIKEVISTLLQNNIYISGVYLASEGYINICKNIQKSIFGQKHKKDTYYFVYMLNSNGDLCEFTMKNNNVINYTVTDVNESAIPKTAQDRFLKNKRQLLFRKVPEKRIYFVALLPEQWRPNISISKHSIFLSTRDIASKLLKRKASGLCNYSSILTEIAFIKNKATPIFVRPIRKLKLFYNIYKWISIPAFLSITVMVIAIFYYMISSYTTMQRTGSLHEEIHNIDSTLSRLEKTKRRNEDLLKKNPLLKELYDVIHKNPYSLSAMTKISSANAIPNLPILSIDFHALNVKSKNRIIEIRLESPVKKRNTANYFQRIDAFISNLQSNFVSDELNVHMDNKSNSAPIIIQLISK